MSGLLENMNFPSKEEIEARLERMFSHRAFSQLIADSWQCDVQASIVMMAGNPEPEPGPGGGDNPPPNPSPDPAPDPDPASAPASAPDPAPEPQATKPTPSTDDEWWQRRINKLTAKNKNLEAQLAARVEPTPVPVPAQPPAASPDFQSAVRAEASALAATERFNTQCAEIAEAGRTTFGEETFNRSVSQLISTVDRSDPDEVQAYRGLIEAAIETGEAAQVIQHLGSNPNEAARIMSLPPARMGVELAKLVLGRENKTVTDAPKPASVPRGSGGGNAPHTAIDPTDPERADRLSTAEWMARRAAQESRWDNQTGRRTS